MIHHLCLLRYWPWPYIQARAEMHKDGGQEDQDADDDKPGVSKPASSAVLDKTAMRREEARINSPAARTVWDTLLQPARRDVKEMFLPR